LDVTDHPRQVEYNIQDHEDIVNVMVVAGSYKDPAPACKGSQYADHSHEARKGRRRKSMAVKHITEGNESEART